jgi:integrase
MKNPSFQITFVQSKVALGKSPWCLNVPASLSETGKDQRLYFPTKKAGQVMAEALKNRVDKFAGSLSGLSPVRIAEAAKVYELLEGSPLTLEEAVKLALATYQTQSASVTFYDLATQFMGAKADCNPKYQKELRCCRNRTEFQPFLHKLCCNISPNELEQALAPIPAGSRKAQMRYLRAMFGYGVRKGYLPKNPVLQLDFPKSREEEVETVPNAQVEAMLRDALANDLELLPFLVLGFFCGIRPAGELPELDWTDVMLDDGHPQVVIRPAVSKTNRRRFVDISENAIAWLEAYRLAGGPMTGPIVTMSEDTLAAHRKTNRQAAGVTRWVQQGMRHTFCSNWLALHKDVNKLVLMSGHDSPDTMWRHYHKGVSLAEAKAFWGIRPPVLPAKVVEFKAA